MLKKILVLLGIIIITISVYAKLPSHNNYITIFDDTVKSTGDSVVTILLDTLRYIDGEYGYADLTRSMATYKNSQLWFYCDSVNADSLDLRITMYIAWKDDTTYWQNAIIDSTIDTHKVIYTYGIPSTFSLSYNTCNYLRFHIKGNAGNDKAKGSSIVLKLRFAEDGY